MTSIISNPAADPHDYEPNSADARSMAEAQIAIVNGIGYDTWASKLLAANPTSERTELSVGDLLGLKPGDNPHQWYSPTAVGRVIAQITADYASREPAQSAYFEHRRREFETKGLARYHDLIKAIRRRFAGMSIGASESIFAPLAPALGLRLRTPAGFLNALAEGAEPTPSDKATTERQISEHRIRVWVYNSQNATPDVQRLNEAARANGIPISTVTETLTPEGTSFQAWQVGQLKELQAALAKALRNPGRG